MGSSRIQRQPVNSFIDISLKSPTTMILPGVVSSDCCRHRTWTRVLGYIMLHGFCAYVGSDLTRLALGVNE